MVTAMLLLRGVQGMDMEMEADPYLASMAIKEKASIVSSLALKSKSVQVEG